MKKLIALIVVVVLSVSSVMAGDIKNDAYYKDFIKFLKVSGALENQKVMLKSMFDQYRKMPNAKPEVFNNMEDMMNNELDALNKTLFPVYKKYLSHEDLKAIIKFYESPAGKKMVKSQPLIIKESFQIGVKWGQGVAKRVMEKMNKQSK